MRQFVVGITGSPGSGKTTVAKLLKLQGACIVDVDKAGKWVLDNSLLARQRLREHFGDSVFLEDGQVDRKKLGDIIFADEAQKQALNKIVHPVMINRVRTMISHCNHYRDVTFVVIDAALLTELRLHCETDFVVTVTAPLETRLERLCERHKVSPEKAKQMTNAQFSQEEKIKLADMTIDNSGDLDLLREEVKTLNQKLIEKSKTILH